MLIIALQSALPLTVALLFAVGFACALIPQGLPAEVNTALASAASALAKQKVLVKKISAVETLGATHVICTDKTGTLTKNEMTVTEIVVVGVPYLVTGIGYEPVGTSSPDASSARATAALRDFLGVGVLPSNAKLVPPSADSETWRIFGDPTEGALPVAAAKAGLDLAPLEAEHPEVAELPFDSARKVMTSIRHESGGGIMAYSKGSSESILHRATHISVSTASGHTADTGTTVRPITATDCDALLALHGEKAGCALRNLLYERRTLTEKGTKSTDLTVIEKNLTVLGMVSMIDPIRSAVPDAMAGVLDAGVKVNIITRDFSLTAIAIAPQAGLRADETLLAATETAPARTIPDHGLTIVTGAEVLAHALRGGTVLSRVAPDDKVRIVDLVKASGNLVAVTGDGINDSPALRHANIGVAMGASGTDVAKQTAEVVLLDDSFARLALASLFGVPLALNLLQILAIDLLVEIFPIAALGRDRELPLLLHAQRHRPVHEHRARNVLARATAVTYVTIMVCQLVSIIQLRSVHGFFTRYQFTNHTFWLAILSALAIMLAIVYVPAIATFFGTGPLDFIDWGCVVAAVAAFLALRKGGRMLRRRVA